MNEYKIAVIPGDGIEKEVVREACKVLDSVATKNNFKLNYESFDWGLDFYFKNFMFLPNNSLILLVSVIVWHTFWDDFNSLAYTQSPLNLTCSIIGMSSCNHL